MTLTSFRSEWHECSLVLYVLKCSSVKVWVCAFMFLTTNVGWQMPQRSDWKIYKSTNHMYIPLLWPVSVLNSQQTLWSDDIQSIPQTANRTPIEISRENVDGIWRNISHQNGIESETYRIIGEYKWRKWKSKQWSRVRILKWKVINHNGSRCSNFAC